MPRTYDPEFRRRVVELVRAGRPVRVVAAELGLAEATVYRWKSQDLIDWVVAGQRRAVYGHGVIVNRKTVRKIMRLHGLYGLPGSSKRFRGRANIATTADLVERRFDRPAPDQLWVTDITEHPTGRASCNAVWC